jgi:hypothetical protein
LDIEFSIGKDEAERKLQEIRARKDQQQRPAYSIAPTVESVSDIAPERYQSDDSGDLIPMPFGLGVGSAKESLEDVTGPLIRASEAAGQPKRSRAEILQRAIDIKEGKEGYLGASPTLLGVASTGYSIVAGIGNLVSGATNVLLGGRFTADPDRVFTPEKAKEYEKLYNKKRKEGFWAAENAVAWKAFKDAPELPSAAIFTQGLVKMLSGTDITTREAAELTGIWRPEASLPEQVLRFAPEYLTFKGVGKMIATRGAIPMLKKAQIAYNDLRKKQGKKEQHIENIDEDDWRLVHETVVTNKFQNKFDSAQGKVSSWWANFRASGYAKRVQTVVQEKRMKTQQRKFDEDIVSAKGKLASARSKRDKETIRIETQKIADLNKGRASKVPYEFRLINMTETGATAGTIIAGNLFGSDDYAWMGALGGGLLSGVGYELILRRGGAALGRHFKNLGNDMDKLSDAQREQFLKEGKLPPKIEGFSNAEIDNLNRFADFIRLLPKEQKQAAVDNILMFQRVKEDLTDLGIDPKVLDTTIDKAANMIPLMMIRDTIMTVKLDTTRFKGMAEEIKGLVAQETAVEKQILEFRNALKKLANQSSEYLNGGSENADKLNNFITALNNLDNNIVGALNDSKNDIDSFVINMVNNLTDRQLSVLVGSPQALEELVDTLLEHHFLREGTQSGTKGIDELIGTREKTKLNSFRDLARKLQEQIKIRTEGLEGVEGEEGILGREGILENLASLHDPKTHAIEANKAATELWTTMVNDRTFRHSDGNQMFTDLENLAYEDGSPVLVDISKWMRTLFADNEFTDTFAIPQTQREKVLKGLTDTRLSKAPALNAFANIEAEDSINKALDESDSLKELFVKMHNDLLDSGDISSFKTNADGEPMAITSKDVNHDLLNHIYGSLWNATLINQKRGALGSFDLFKILDDEIKILNKELGKADAIPELRMEISVAELIKIRKALQGQSRELFQNNKLDAAKRYSTVVDNLIGNVEAITRETAEGVDGLVTKELVRRLQAAVDNWSVEVINRYRNPAFNRLGNELSQTVPLDETTGEVLGHKAFINNPANWLGARIRDIMNAKEGEAEQLAKALERDLAITFGEYDYKSFPPQSVYSEPNAEAYVLNDEQRQLVKNLMNAAFSNEFQSKKELVKASRSIGKIRKKVYKETTGKQKSAVAKKLLDDLKVLYRGADSKAHMALEVDAGMTIKRKMLADATKSFNEMESPGLLKLQELGVLDAEEVLKYNDSIERYLTEENLLTGTIEDLAKGLQDIQKRLSTEFNTRKTLLDKAIKKLGIEEVSGIDSYERMYEYFVKSGVGSQRVDKIVPLLAKDLDIPESEVKKIISDIVIEGLAKSTQKQPILATGAGLTGEVIRPFKVGTFFEEVVNNEENLKYLAGEKSYESIKNLAKIMTIFNKDARSRLSDTPVGLRVPAGLSVESYISRLYSISRGIISPKYVATEVALLGLRMKKVEILGRMLSDPKVTEAFIQVLESGGETIPPQFWPKLNIVIMNTLAESLYDKDPEDVDLRAQEDLSRQMNQLMQ